MEKISETGTRRYLQLELPTKVSPRLLVNALAQLMREYTKAWLLRKGQLDNLYKYISTQEGIFERKCGIRIETTIGRGIELEDDIPQGTKIKFSTPKKHPPEILETLLSNIIKGSQ